MAPAAISHRPSVEAVTTIPPMKSAPVRALFRKITCAGPRSVASANVLIVIGKELFFMLRHLLPNAKRTRRVEVPL